MRRIHDAHYPAIPDSEFLSYWSCDLSNYTTSTIADSSTRGNHLRCYTGANSYWYTRESLFGDTTVSTPSTFGGVSSPAIGWAESNVSAASMAPRLATANWSLAMWAGNYSANTMAFLEFSRNNTVASAQDQMLLGVYSNADGNLAYSWDISTSTRYTYATGVTLPIGYPCHIGLINERSPVSSTFIRTTFLLDGVVRDVSDAGVPITGTNAGASCVFTLGASKRLSTNPSSPAFASYQKVMDDVVLIDRAVSTDKVRELYRNNMRGWNERRLFDNNGCIGKARVLVEDGDGNYIDLSAYYSTDFVQNVSVNDSVDSQYKTAKVSLLRYRGERLNLAPLDEQAVNNLGNRGAGSYEPLLEYRRRIRIETAVFPRGVSVGEWLYETLFDGYIDGLSWSDTEVSIDAIDKIAPLMDQYQLDPKFYAYGEVSTTLAETHLQTVINNNVPTVVVGSATLVFGYKGGTPTLYTPASSGWVLRYDDSPSGEVATLLQGIADQIGWRCRYQWDQYRQEDRLTFSAPIRSKVYQVAEVSRKQVGKHIGTSVKTTIPHDFTLEQMLTLAGTVTNNFTDSPITRIISNREVLVAAYPGVLGATETNVGTLGYNNTYEIAGAQILGLSEVRKDTQSIRNSAHIKYNRNSTPVTFGYSSIQHTGTGQPLQVFIDDDEAITAMRNMESGRTSFTISGASVAIYNRSWTFNYVDGGVVYSLETIDATATISYDTGYFQSSYINCRDVVSVNTPSISKYGFRPVGIYEASNGNINTAAEARKLALAVINDLAEPTESLEVTIPFAPWFDLDSAVGLLADARRRWSTDLDVTVTGVEHTLSGGSSSTKLKLRKANPTNGTAWVSRIGVDGDKPSLPGTFQGMPEIDLLDNISTGRGLALAGRTLPEFLSNSGPRQARRIYTEMHVGNTPTFAPDNSTLAAIGLGNEVSAFYDPQGNLIRPGSSYYVRYRQRDILGNPAPFDWTTTPATRQIPRFNDRGVSIIAEGCPVSMQFRTGGWSPFPFNYTSNDNYANFQIQEQVYSATLPFCQTGTGAYFRFPANGTAVVTARLGVWNDGTVKANVPVAFGIMVLGSVPNSSGSRPLFAKFGGASEATPDWNPGSALFVGTSVSSLFVNLNGVVHGSSGDYLQIGVLPVYDDYPLGNINMSGVRACVYGYADTWTAACASWAKITFTQD